MVGYWRVHEEEAVPLGGGVTRTDPSKRRRLLWSLFTSNLITDCQQAPEAI